MRVQKDPNLTLFPPLALRFDDEGNAESLDHYLVRLSDAVGLSMPAVIRMLSSHSGAAVGGLNSYKGRSVWIGPGPSNQEFVAALSSATGNHDLYRGTFANLSAVMQGIGLANSSASVNARKWCPTCYKDWDHHKSMEPLYWAFGALTQCPIHECRLLNRCVHCGSRQRHVVSYRIRRQCWCCLEHLGGSGETFTAGAYENWVNQQCIQTARVATTSDGALHATTFDRYLERVLDRGEGGEPIAGYVKASMSDLRSRWRKGERHLRPTMTQYLNFASFHGTTVEEIMLSPESAAAEPLIEGADHSFTRFSHRMPRKQTLDRLRCALERLSDSGITMLPTATAVSDAFEIDLAYARERMPEVIDRYSAARELKGRAYTKQELRRAFCCAIATIRSRRNDPGSDLWSPLVAEVASRARCGEVVAGCAAEAAFITLG